MDLANSTTVTDVANVVASTLGLDGQPLEASTPLFGSLPELDSMAVVELIAALEGQFGIEIDEDEVTEAVFETLGSLAALVEAKRVGGSRP